MGKPAKKTNRAVNTPGTSNTIKKDRQANFELLRILAMAMVITLHFLSKGGLLTDFSEKFALRDHVVWLTEAFCSVAVNVYVLISGYFLVDARFRSKKVLKLWAQVLFYSAGVPAACLFAGILQGGEITLDRAVTWILPILREHYWFATIYLLLYVLSPLLGKAVRSMEKKELCTVLWILLAFSCFGKTILPVNLALDTGGYDLLWFLCLYLTAAWLRLYGIPKWLKGWRGAACYAIGGTAVYGLSMAYRAVYFRTGRLADFYTGPYQYNHLLCLFAAVSLFGAFSAVRIAGEKAARIICTVASCTFGIYLLHENEVIRNLWPAWFGAGEETAGIALLGGWFAAVCVWYAAGIVIELVRQMLFRSMKIDS